MARKLALLALCSVTVTGCNSVDNVIKMFNDQVGHRIGFRIEPIAAKPSPAPTGTSGASGAEQAGPDNRAVNAAYLKELFKVVLLRDLRNQEEFDKFMNVMDQGGSYEGIYNGLVYSQEYKDKEKGVAPVSAVKAFADVMAQLKLDQKYDPLKISAPETNDPLDTDRLEPPQPTELERTSLIGDFEREAMALPLFTLKRKLGEEVIRTIELKREYKEKFATWYGRFSVFLNKKDVDFGVPLRNRKDEYYHYKWALDAEEDRLRWESLNRVHVLLNAYAK